MMGRPAVPLVGGGGGGCGGRLVLPTTAALLLPSTTTAWSPRARPRRLRRLSASSSSYKGWDELPDFSFPLLLQEKKQKSRGLLLVLLVAIPASAAAALSRLPPLPLLAAAFTAGFAARHLSCPQPSALTPVLADLDAQVRALRDQLTSSSSSSSHSQPVLDALDRLRDAVLHATRLAHRDTIAPVLGDLADSVAAWARGTMRDLTSTRNKPPDLDSKASSSSAPIKDKPVVPSSGQDMLPFDNQEEEEATSPELERLLLKHRRRGSSTLLEKRTLEIRDRSYRLDIDRHSHVISESQEVDPFAAATDSDSQEFGRNVKEAAQIMNKARECMMAGSDEETADALLYRSARLLSTAVALRPTSLVAVGQLGNTYLLHGELKLRISRELRTLLATTTLANARARKRMLSRDNISAALVDVCEECESLLLEAGRSYRTALSVDSGDVKALYNWGLALIFRAQLLADIGPEAAVDADRVYLAAIDKFDAMLSKSNTYAPEALYRWGTALQQRSHLRPRNNRERVRLLEQAKSLFEDVLYVEADNKIVREALSSCISELNYHGRWI